MKRKKMIYIGYIWAEKVSSAAGRRTWNLLDSFLSKNWDIHYLSASKENKFSEELKKYSIKTYPIQLNSSSFDLLIRELNADYVCFDRFITEEQYGWRVEKNCPKALRILDTQDLHFLRKARESLKAFPIPKLKQINLYTEYSKREIASIYRSDLSLLSSNFEYNLLVKEFTLDPDLLFYLPLLYKGIPPLSSLPSFSQRHNFCFIGNFQHAPNRDAVLYMKEKLWPKISQSLLQAEMHIYGAYMDKAMKALENKRERFYLKGFTADQFSTLKNYRIQLTPLRFGAGMKGKITDAFYAGTPSITTHIGSESIGAKELWQSFVAKDEAEFIDLALNAYRNETIWSTQQKKALHSLQEGHSFTENSLKLLECIEDKEKNLKEYRRKNFIGSILHYSKNRNTEYFSRWIEEKIKASRNTNCHQ